MVENVIHNPLATPVFYEFRKSKPIFESFKNLCKKFGPDSMIYPDFEYWWMRFEQGKFDLDYDRSQDPKYRTFIDLPDNVLQKIYESGDVGMCFTLRHVCRSLRTSVDKWTTNITLKPSVQTIQVASSPGNVRLTLGPRNMIYKKVRENRFHVVHSIGKEEDRVYEYYQDGSYMDVAIDDLYSILKNTKLLWKSVKFTGTGIEQEFAKKMYTKFGSLEYKICASEVWLHYGYFLPMIRHFESGFLEDIYIQMDRGITVVSTEDFEKWMRTLNESEQCQRAGWIYLDQDMTKKDEKLTIVREMKCTRVSLKYDDLSTEKAEIIVKILLQSATNYDKIRLHSTSSSIDTVGLKQKLLEFGAAKAWAINGERVLVYQRPHFDDDEGFIINIKEKSIYIEKGDPDWLEFEKEKDTDCPKLADNSVKRPKMVENENSLVVRRHILNAFHDGKTMFGTFKNLRGKFGDGFMDYQEFDLWWMRFEQGKFDLDYDFDRSYTNSSDCEEFSIWSWPGEVLVIMVNQRRTTSNHRLTYTKITDDLYTVFDTKDCYEYVKRGDFRDKAVEDIYSILQSRLNELSSVGGFEEFTINGHHMETEFARKLIRKCRGLKGKIGAGKLQIPIGPFLPMLQYLRPWEIEIRTDQAVTVVTKEDFENAVETMNDQCQSATISFSKKMMIMDTEWTVIKKLMCPKVKVFHEILDVEDTMKILKVLLEPSPRLMTGVNVISKSLINETEIMKRLTKLGAVPRPQCVPWYKTFTYESPYPDDDAFFYIHIYSTYLRIEKCKKSRYDTVIKSPVNSKDKTMSENPPKMPENVLNNPIAQQSFILYEFLKKNPIFETFKKLCGKFEGLFMDYQEFEFWWMRFEQGKFDLDYDRSQDPKYRTFDDLPMDILEKVFSKIDVNMHFILRHVCRPFRALADKVKIDAGNFLRIESSTGKVQFTVGCWRLKYRKISDNKFIVTNGCESYESEKEGKSHLENCRDPSSCYKYVQSGNYQDVAIDDIYSVLSHPELTVNELDFDNWGLVEPGFAEKLYRKFGSLKHKIHVKELEMPFGAFIPMLEFLQPGFLRKIDLSPDYQIAEFSTKTIEEGMKKINKMEQYQQTKLAYFSNDLMGKDSRMKIVENLESSKFILCYEELSTTQMVAVLKVLLQSSRIIQKGLVAPDSSINLDELKKILCEFGAIDISRNAPEDSSAMIQYQSQDSELIYTVTFDENYCATIETECFSVLVELIDF